MFLLIAKPAGRTSHDVVNAIRRVTGERRVGHAGTLDPFATGLLIIGVGRESTRQLGDFLKLPKEYLATLELGVISTTGDPEGVLTPSADLTAPTGEQVDAVLQTFIGEQLQLPPMHSAKKVGGKKLYQLARAGMIVERQPTTVTITSLIVETYQYPHLVVRVACSSGTYIRALAQDIGAALGTGAYCTALERTAIGPYRLENAASLDVLTAENWHGQAVSALPLAA